MATKLEQKGAQEQGRARELTDETQSGSWAVCTPKPQNSRFDWGPDNDDLLVPSQPALAVYVNPWGQIVIRQEGEIFQDDSYVIIGSAHVPALIEKLQELISDTDLPSL